MNYYVVSPNVWNNDKQETFEEIMFDEHIVLMGWDKNSDKGKIFSNIKIGDVLIVAQGANWQKKSLFAGVVSSAVEPFDSEIGEVEQSVHLDNFTDLREVEVPFNTDCAFGESKQIPAIYSLKPNENEADKNVINKIMEYIMKTQNKQSMQKYTDLLKSKKNLILSGAPGTGKTYTTEEIAVGLIDGKMPVPIKVDGKMQTQREATMKRYQELVKEGQIAFTTFHQSMDYEEFVEGLKPNVENGQMIYEVKDGIFKKMCEKAKIDKTKNIVDCIDVYLQTIKGFYNKKTIPTIIGKSQVYIWWNEGAETINVKSTISKSTKAEDIAPVNMNIEKIKLQALGEGKENNWIQYAQAFINAVKTEFKIENQKSDIPHILIIDEINRGNISKILGELITLLEADKRLGKTNEISVTLPYSNEQFSVPQNLYIIGTMNTADRSLGYIDYAIRRRFAFVTLKADAEILKNFYNTKDENHFAVKLFNTIKNNFFGEGKISPEFNAEDLMIGHSYFMVSRDTEEETEEDLIAKLQQKLEYEIKPLLIEYRNDGILNVEKDEIENLQIGN